MTNQTDPLNQPLCSLKGCPSIASKTIEINTLIDQFITDVARENPKAHPLCIKRIVSELLTEKSSKLFREFLKVDK